MADAPGYAALLDDLDAEESALDAVVAELTGDAWLTATPAVGWDVRDTIAHLAAAEDLASLALGDPAAFDAELTRLVADLDTTGDELHGTRARARRRRRARVVAHRSRPHGHAARRAAAARPCPVGVGSDVGDVVRDRAAHGDVGPRRRRPRRARRRVGADGPAAPRRRARRPHPRHTPTPCAAASCPTATCGSSSPGPTARRGRGANPPPTSCAALPPTSASSSRSAATSADTALEVSRPARVRVDADRPGVRRPAHRPPPRDLTSRAERVTTSDRPGR